MKRQLNDLLAPLHRGPAIRRLRRLERGLPSQRMRLATPFAFRGHGLFKSISPRQNPTEIEQLYDRVCAQCPRRVLEIGTARGGTLYLWTQAAAANATIVSADLPGGAYGGGYAMGRTRFYESFARPGQTLHLLRVDSHDARSRSEIEQRFGGEAIDFAFIDGDHSYEGVKADFHDYAPLVRPGGLIAFHDILPREDEDDIEVDRFWNEIRGDYTVEEYIGAEGSGRQIGIGIIEVPAGGLRTTTRG